MRAALGRRYLKLPKPARVIMHVVVFVLMAVWFTPILAMLISSFRTQTDTAASGWWTMFVSPLFSIYNYRQALEVVGIGGSTITSLAIAIPATVLATFVCAVGGFAMSRMRFRGQTALLIILVALLAVPPQVTFVPLLQLFGVFGLNGTVVAVWIYQVGVTVPFGIFLTRGFMTTLPDEIFEAAALDGAAPLRIFRSVVLPLSLPILASLAILQFLWSWNDLLTPLLFMGGTDWDPALTVRVAGLAQSYNQGQSLSMASAFLSVIIPLIILIGLQKYFVKGILAGAVKD